MIALVTGASSGIGRDISRELFYRGYDLIIAARDEKKLEELKINLEEQNKKQKVYVKTVDLSNENECKNLYNYVKKEFENIDVLVNNAGFGLFGKFTETNLDIELNMIRTNVEAVHILTKLFLKDMVKVNKGKILNVASVAGFMPGPLMATYYSTKNYVFRLSQSIKKELKKMKSNVQISVLCPGPVDTNFNNVAGVRFGLKEANSQDVAKYAVNKMEKGKFKIIPRFEIKIARICSKIFPDELVAEFAYYAQRRKM